MMHHSSKSLPAIVYLVTNKVNGKRYIGVTTRALKLRIAEHFNRAKRGKSNGAFDKAIRKYGRDAFEFSILVQCATGEDGLQQEVRLIAEIRPEYNSTAGGDGNVGRKISADARRRLSNFHTGKKWHLGHRHSEDAKEAIRAAQLTPEIIAAWSERAKLGPLASARPVVCLDDNRVFPSVRAAAREYGVDDGALVQVCSGKRYRKTIGGRRFAYAEAA